MRIQVFLSHNGVCSRREAMKYVQDGRVSLNGKVVLEPSYVVNPAKDKIEVDGRLVQAKNLQYVLLHKPAGFVTTKEDAHAERTVMDLLPSELKHLVPVGRLDKDTEGLLLLTNDGDLTFRLTHPQFSVDKTYVVHIGGRLINEKKNRLEKGVMVEGRMTHPAVISELKETKDQSEFLMMIHEGRKRQVRLMLRAVGCAVRYLKRISQGSLHLGNLPLGKWRELTKAEIEQLKSLSSPKKLTRRPQEIPYKQPDRPFNQKVFTQKSQDKDRPRMARSKRSADNEQTKSNWTSHRRVKK